MSKSFDEVAEKFRNIKFKENFDLIVAVANGGVIPAAILNQRLGLDLQLLKINFRAADQSPIYETPRLLSHIDFEVKGKTVLLVEDRVKTGASLQFAKKLLSDAKLIKTFAVNGKADYSLYDEDCFRFPWII